MIRYKIILFFLIMIGISYLLERITRNKFENKPKFKFIIFSSVIATLGFIIGFIIFYLLS
ncbi:MAG: hypothetical protein CL706_02970 [Chloroflexi bacterium]|jgi:hypothetical protein|nr:hypothetical protein [Chloroflexota bacterium]